jgi:hypothetical protein
MTRCGFLGALSAVPILSKDAAPIRTIEVLPVSYPVAAYFKFLPKRPSTDKLFWLSLALALPAFCQMPFAWKDLGGGRMGLSERDKPALVYNYGPQLRPGAPEDRRRCCYIFSGLHAVRRFHAGRLSQGPLAPSRSVLGLAGG